VAEANGHAPRETRQITFQGRAVTVAMPTDGQLAVWKRTASRFASVDVGELTGEEVGKLLDRGVRVIQSVMASQADRDWLEDELLDGVLTLEAAAGIITEAIAAFRDDKPAPKTGPIKKARRAR
jgi:hypothetical protein